MPDLILTEIPVYKVYPGGFQNIFIEENLVYANFEWRYKVRIRTTTDTLKISPYVNAYMESQTANILNGLPIAGAPYTYLFNGDPTEEVMNYKDLINGDTIVEIKTSALSNISIYPKTTNLLTTTNNSIMYSVQPILTNPLNGGNPTMQIAGFNIVAGTGTAGAGVGTTQFEMRSEKKFIPFQVINDANTWVAQNTLLANTNYPLADQMAIVMFTDNAKHDWQVNVTQDLFRNAVKLSSIKPIKAFGFVQPM
jgi:hypothetical protein